jgi:hypothetical protein
MNFLQRLFHRHTWKLVSVTCYQVISVSIEECIECGRQRETAVLMD